MAIIYVNIASGNDSTGDGSASLPYLTVNKAVSIAGGPHDIRVAKTTAAASIAGNTWTWTYNSLTVTVNADVTASVASGDFIGKPTATGNGSFDTFYKVNGTPTYSAGTGLTTITLLNKYHGTTTTTTGALKQAIVTTGASNATAMTIGTSGTTLSGGWNLSGTPTQDGETWFQPNGTAGSYVGIAQSATCTISKINQVNSSQALSNSSNITLSNCTFIPVGGASYGMLSQTSNINITFTDIMFFAGTTTAPLYTFSSTTATHTFTRVYLNGGTQCWYIGGQINKGNVVINSIYGYFGATVGVSMAVANQYLDATNLEIYNTATGISAATLYNYYVKGGKIYNSTNGISMNASTVIDGMTFTNCTSGIYISNGTRNVLRVTACTFVGCQYCVNTESYSGLTFISNCDFGTPTTYAVNRTTMGNTIKVDSCTIAAGEEAKLINNTGADIQINPYYIVVNCSNSSYPDGAYYGYLTVTLNNTTYESSAPSIRIKNSTTQSANQVQDVPFITTYTQSGAGKTFSMRILGDTSWVGSITPVWYLNGTIVKEETAITSIPNSFNTYAYTISNALITRKGYLTLAFRSNMNTVGIYVDRLITIS
jgi:hypothetical protein